MNLHPKWKAILLRAWSMRLNALVALTSATDAAISYIVDGRVGASLVVFVMSIGTSAARVIQQKDLHDDE